MNHEAFRLHGPAVPAVPLVLDSPHSGLRFPFSKKLVAATQLNLDWTREPPAGKKTTDRTFLFTMGYQW